MGLFRKIIYSFFLFLLVSILGLSSVFAVTGEHPVLIISSYNPDARQTSGVATVEIENGGDTG